MPGVDRDLWKEADRVILLALTALLEFEDKDSPSVMECGGHIEILRELCTMGLTRALEEASAERAPGDRHSMQRWRNWLPERIQLPRTNFLCTRRAWLQCSRAGTDFKWLCYSV